MQKGQVLILVLFLLLFVEIIGAGLIFLWECDIRGSFAQEENLRAFYISQAGIEQAKAELVNNWDWAGMDINGNDIVDVGEQIAFRGGNYWVDIVRPGPNIREIHSRGWQGNSERRIRVDVENTLGPITLVPLSWGEE